MCVCKEDVKRFLKYLPFYIMTIFAVVHMGSEIQLNFLGRSIRFSFLNQIISMLYITTAYLWALCYQPKKWIRLTAVAVGLLSVLCVVVSLPELGNSFNDALCAGSAVLSVLYVFENAWDLLELIRKNRRLLTFAIWFFVVFSLILFVFFPQKITDWGDGDYFFGHRYASVCGLITLLIGLKFLNHPNHPAVYWILLFLSYFICFWTGARVYVLSGLGTVYVVLYTFRKGKRDFILKCTAVTIAAIVLFFTSPTFTKNANIVESITGSAEASPERNVYVYGWVNGMSNDRLFMWNNCMESYRNLPFLNKLIGSGNKYIYDQNNGLYAHMDFLNILHFNGFLGLAIYLSVHIGYVLQYWRRNRFSVILLIGFWGIWFTLAFLNGYMNYTANMMSLPYIAVLGLWEKQTQKGEHA